MPHPIYVANSASTSEDGSKVYLTYDQDLDDSATPAPGDFTVSVEDIGGAINDVSVSEVLVSGDRVELSLEDADPIG